MGSTELKDISNMYSEVYFALLHFILHFCTTTGPIFTYILGEILGQILQTGDQSISPHDPYTLLGNN